MHCNVHYLDIRETLAPIALLKAIQAFRSIQVGEALDISGNDPDTRADLIQVLDSFVYRVLAAEERADGYRLRIQKQR